MNLKYSGVFPIYKKKAAAQFTIIKPKIDNFIGKLKQQFSIFGGSMVNIIQNFFGGEGGGPNTFGSPFVRPWQ